MGAKMVAQYVEKMAYILSDSHLKSLLDLGESSGDLCIKSAIVLNESHKDSHKSECNFLVVARRIADSLKQSVGFANAVKQQSKPRESKIISKSKSTKS